MDSIFEALVALIGAVITCFLIPYLRTKTTLAQREEVALWIGVAVAAAEQLFEGREGSEKLSYVLNYLEQLGVEVTVEEVESAVFWLNATQDDQEGVFYES